MPRISTFLSVLFFLSPLVIPSTDAALDYIQPADSCYKYTSLGQSQMCCDLYCINGSLEDEFNNYAVVGSCKAYNDPCLDPAYPTVCPPDQYWYTGAGGEEIVTGGVCNYPGLCEWSQMQYTYYCCPCPDGYVAGRTGCQDLTHYTYPGCIGCSGIGESLIYNETTLQYSCVGGVQQELCAAAQSYNNVIGAVNTASTWLGNFCPTTNLKSVIITALEDTYSFFNLWLEPTKGVAGTEFGAVSSAINTIKTFFVGAAIVIAVGGTAEADAAIGAAYVAACNVNTAVGGIATGIQAAIQAIDYLGCPHPDPLTTISTKRSVDSFFDVDSMNSLAKRDSPDYNPCSTLISNFPSGFANIATAAYQGCSEISIYKASVTSNATLG